MTPEAKKRLIGAIVAAALAIAVYYGLIDQKQADSIRNQADQTLGTGSNPQQQPQQTAPQQPQQSAPGQPPQPAPQQVPTAPQNPAPAPAPPPAPAPQNETPSPQR